MTMNFDSNQHLKDVLDSHKMRHIQDFNEKVLAKKNEIVDELKAYYSDKAYPCFNSGSMAKHTAINLKFDYDIVLPFKYTAFKRLEDMFEDVFSFLSERYKDKATVRKQKVSIGIEFPQAPGDRSPISIDVVPGREMSEGSYGKDSKALNLYCNEDAWGEKKGSYQKTDISRQIDHIKGKDEERQIIRLLKIWKKSRGKDYKSFMLELACIKAFENYIGSSSLSDRLVFAMEYIRDNITSPSFHLYDPGNSNNDLMGSMDSKLKEQLKQDLAIMLINIDQSPSGFLPYYFPINKEFAPNKGDGYQRKDSADTVSYPRSIQRFG